MFYCFLQLFSNYTLNKCTEKLCFSICYIIISTLFECYVSALSNHTSCNFVIHKNENEADGILNILKSLHECHGDDEGRKYGDQGVLEIS